MLKHRNPATTTQTAAQASAIMKSPTKPWEPGDYVDAVSSLPDPPSCIASADCLKCPAPVCRHDDPARFRRWLWASSAPGRGKARGAVATRVREILELNLTPKEASVRFGVHIRQAYRYHHEAQLMLKDYDGLCDRKTDEAPPRLLQKE